MEALVELIAKYLGLASDFVTANFDKYYNQLLSMKIGSHILGLVIGCVLIIFGFTILILISKDIYCEDDVVESHAYIFIGIGVIVVCIATYFLICWTKAPDIMLVNWLLKNLK